MVPLETKAARNTFMSLGLLSTASLRILCQEILVSREHHSALAVFQATLSIRIRLEILLKKEIPSESAGRGKVKI